MASNWVKSVASFRKSVKAAAIAAILLPGATACAVQQVTQEVTDVGVSAFHLVTLGIFDDGTEQGTIDEGRVIGYVSGDEPTSILIAEQMLRNGGSAADAAASMYFALSVTYPSAAGLGGGGACTYYERASGTLSAFDFMPAPVGTDPASTIPVPGNVAGFGEMQKIFGRMPWSQIIVRAEALAQAGFKASRATAKSFSALPPTRRGSRMLASIVKTPEGRPITEGAEVRNTNLAATLADLRLNGADSFYKGPLSKQIVMAGGSIRVQTPSADDLANYIVERRPAGILRIGGARIGFAGSGEGTALLTKMATDPEALHRIPRSGGIAAQTGLWRELEAHYRREVGLPADYAKPKSSSTTFSVVDYNGNAASCYVTTQGPLGSGVMVGNLGFVFPAPNASNDGRAAQAGAVAGIILDGNSFRVTGGSSGGYGAQAALLGMAMEPVIDGDISFDTALQNSSSAQTARANGIACFGNVRTATNCEAAVANAGHGLGRRVRY